ncbi:MAG TPA: peptidase M23 [Oribacterium sp.]|nr:peptidase M23 [Oribacterium sp.]
MQPKVFAAEKEKQAIQDSKKKIGDNKEKIDALKKEQEKVNAAISSIKDLKANTTAAIRTLDQNMSDIEKELDTINRYITQKEKDIAFTREELNKATQQQSDQYASTKLRIKFMYEKGTTSFIDLILTSKNWAELLNRAEYISQITQYDRKKLDEYAAIRQKVVDTETQLNNEQAELLSMKEEATAKQQSIQKLLNAKNQELANYNQKLKSEQEKAIGAQNKIDDLQAEIKKQEANIAAMEKEIERQEAEARKKAEAEGKTYKTRTLSGGLIWPCPASSRITSTFGSRESPTEGASSYHKGIDIGAATGSKVIAAASGEVVIATYSASAGNYVMISHGSGVYTVYMHMSSIAVSEGQEVSQGQTIGAVGSTGYSTGSHLHFGVRKNGSYVDPMSYVG